MFDAITWYELSLCAHGASPPAAVSSAEVSEGQVQTQSTSNEPLFLKFLNLTVSTERVATRPFQCSLPAKPNLLLTSLYFSMGPTSNEGWVHIGEPRRDYAILDHPKSQAACTKRATLNNNKFSARKTMSIRITTTE